MQESSLLLASLLQFSLNLDSHVICCEEVKATGDTFLRVLTRCRHRGAIEGSNVGFGTFCAHLFKSDDPSLQRIPTQLLQQTLDPLTSPATKTLTSSITRRSAGLPLVVQTILVSEGKARQVLYMRS